MKKQDKKVNVKNRRAGYDYEFIESYTAGIVLEGGEVKAIQWGLVSINGSYCFFKNGELWVKNLEIGHWGQMQSHDKLREKKLLLTKKQLKSLERELIPGRTIILKGIHSDERKKIKVDIALAKGKKDYDKRQAIKERDIERDKRKGI
jgi:SsrA-binding protein